MKILSAFLSLLIVNQSTTLQAQSQIVWKHDNLSCVVMEGTEARAHLNAIVRDCVAIFSEAPYYYTPSFEVDLEFFNSYCEAKRHVFLVIFDGTTVVGFSHAIGVDETIDEIKKPFVEAGLNPRNYLYISEALLKQSYRGQKGLFKAGCDYYEAFARKNGFTHITTALIHDPVHDRVEKICQHFGFTQTSLYFTWTWKRADTGVIQEHKLNLWAKNVPAA